MTKVGLTAALIAITSLTGCAKTVLAKPGVDQAQFQRDKYECMQNAQQSAMTMGVAGNPFFISGELNRCMVEYKGYSRVKQ